MALQRAIEGGRFLAAIFRIEGEPPQLVLDFAEMDFPVGDYPESIRMLRNHLAQRLDEHLRRSVAEGSKPLLEKLPDKDAKPSVLLPPGIKIVGATEGNPK